MWGVQPRDLELPPRSTRGAAAITDSVSVSPVELGTFWGFLSASPASYPLALGALAVGALVAYIVTPATGWLARRFGVLDHPDPDPSGRKTHEESTPYLGGVAIICGLAAGSLFVVMTPDVGASTVIENIPALLGVAVVIAAIGLADDIRTLPRWLRAGAQIAAALLAWWGGFRVQLPWEVLNLPITLLWIVGVTNAFNLLDNMDGLTAGIAGVGALSFAVMGVVGNLFIVPIIAAALAGAAFGFLAHNRHPAKIFLGDAGSMFIGFLLALIGLQLRFENLVNVTFLVPVVVLGVPIMDTTLVALSRLRHHRPVFLGGRDHISHRLVQLGLPVKAAVHVLYWAALCLGFLGLVISRANQEVAYMLLGFVVVVGVYLARFLWRVPVYANSAVALYPIADPIDGRHLHKDQVAGKD